MDKRTLPNDILLGEVAAVLREGREAIITPTGNSMLPFIRGGRDRVVLRKQDEVSAGDIVLIHTGGRYILHRIIQIDGNCRGIEHGTRAEIVGTVTEILRPDGRSVKPGTGRFWRFLKPFRRYILFIYRRLI